MTKINRHIYDMGNDRLLDVYFERGKIIGLAYLDGNKRHMRTIIALSRKKRDKAVLVYDETDPNWGMQ